MLYLIEFFKRVGMQYYYTGKRLYYVNYNGRPCKMSNHHLRVK